MTTEYVIYHLAPGQKGGFTPRGAVKQLWQTRDFETIVSGPAETGKTFGFAHYANSLLWKYPGAQGILCRKVYADLIGSVLRTYKRILGDNTPVKAFGGERPQWFDYPNGSRLWLAGMDNPGKALSSERDFVWVNQAEELALGDWETLSTRCTGRGAVMPYTRIFGEANPGPPNHWILSRARSEKLLLLESRHTDNPTLYTDEGELTEQGKRTMTILKALSGVRRLRLFLGKWAAAEGAVYEDFDRAIHVIDKRPIPSDWRRIRSIDFGFTNPFVCQWWAIDPDGRMYLYREIYFSRRLVEDHANGVKDSEGNVISKGINELSAGERYEATVADHDAEDRATLERYGIETTPAFKAVSVGIEGVASRLKKAGDGKPRIFIMRGATVEIDDRLTENKAPTSTEHEIPEYSYPKGADGKPIKEAPLKVNDHGCDAGRYAVAYVDDLENNGEPWKQADIARVLSYAEDP